MNKTGIERFISRMGSACLLVTLFVVYSMVTLAVSTKPLGELTVSGEARVTVNGEPAQTGRTVFASSTIVTPENGGATVTLGKVGKIELAPNTTFLITAEGDIVGGDLTSGSVTAIGTANNLGIKTSAGKIVNLAPGETAVSGVARPTLDHIDKTTGKCIDDDNDGKLECDEGLPAWFWYAAVGGIAAAVIIGVAVSGDDDKAVVSPVR